MTPTGSKTFTEGIGDLGNYYSWIYSTLRPFLGKAVLEIGPGPGAFARELKNNGIQYFAIDNDAQIISDLAQSDPSLAPRLWHGDVSEISLRKPEWIPQIDTLVSMNVLEHIRDDGAHLQQLLRAFPRATLVLMVPALPCLYGSCDRQAGHYRRYTAATLRARLTDASYTVSHLRYFHGLGTLTWWISARLLSLPLQGSSTSRLARYYDRFGIPLARCVDPALSSWFGQSLVAIASPSPHA